MIKHCKTPCVRHHKTTAQKKNTEGRSGHESRVVFFRLPEDDATVVPESGKPFQSLSFFGASNNIDDVSHNPANQHQ